ncbi:MAG TPA: VWA domain-containing protein [Candidatus Solibacter sp.]|jgi:Ca-activated chloride channel family protein|nr:VWA domain-containing protein [Candidatus Solibacter sp.]
MPKRTYRPPGRCTSTGRIWAVLCLAPVVLLPLVHALAFQVSAQQDPAQQVPPQDADREQRPGEFKISTDVLLVVLDVSVKDSKGGYVSGLTKEDFRVYENGIAQKLTVFSSADEPVTVGLVIDESGSMRSKHDQVVTAGLSFIGASNPNDQMFVVNFNDTVRSGLPDNIPFSDDLAVLHAALSRNKPDGQTALYDAVAFALQHLELGQRDKKMLVVVSDGGDNRSKLTLPGVMKLIQESHATIYAIGIYDRDDTDHNPEVLKRMANAGGGEWFLPQLLDQIGPICRKIAKDIRNRYTIGYIPDRNGNQAAIRKIKVDTSAQGHEKLIVRTRTSYSLPDALTQGRAR